MLAHAVHLGGDADIAVEQGHRFSHHRSDCVDIGLLSQGVGIPGNKSADSAGAHVTEILTRKDTDGVGAHRTDILEDTLP